MRDIALWRDNGASQEWDDLPEQIRESLETIIRCRDIIKTTVACQSILIGKEVHMISVYSDHGTAVALIERHTGLKKSQCYNFRQVYLQFGQEYLNGGVKNSNRLEFSDTVLGILAQAPDPQAALEEANERKEAGEEVTAKAAKEIAAAQKAQREAEARVEAVQLKLDDAMAAMDKLQDDLEEARKTTLSAATPRGRDLLASGKIRRMAEELRDIVAQVGEGGDRQHTDEAMLKLARVAAEWFGLDVERDPYAGLPENLAEYLKNKEAA